MYENIHQTVSNIDGSLNFTRRSVDTDGDCGYTAFGITRQNALSLLTQHLLDVHFLLKPVVKEQLHLNAFIIYLQQQGAPSNLLPIFNTYQNATGANSGNSVEQLERFADDLVIVQGYLNYDVRDKNIDTGWAHPCVLQALAHIQKIRLRIWQLNQENQLIPHEYYHDYGSCDLPCTDILFINNNHFERLESTVQNENLKRMSQFTGNAPHKKRRTDNNRPLRDIIHCEYNNDSHFLEYAFPEHQLENNALDISEYQDLYDAKFTYNHINLIVNQIKTDLEKAQKPYETEICFEEMFRMHSNRIEDIGAMLKPLKSRVSQKTEVKKWIILVPLGIDKHAYALMIHINLVNPIKITMSLWDPYGKRNDFETVCKRIFSEITLFFIKFFASKKLTLHLLNTSHDLQGFKYDESNCTVLTLFILQKYLFFALQGIPPEQYKIIFSFDGLPDKTVNESLHKAFILRLKASHIILVNNNQTKDNLLCFDDKINACALKLFETVCNTAKLKYSPFLSTSFNDMINGKANLEQYSLFNYISFCMMENHLKYYNVSPPKFSTFLKGALKNFFKLEKSLNKDDLFKVLTNIDAGIRLFSGGRIPTSSKDQTYEKLTNLACKANDYNSFYTLLNEYKRSPFYLEKITQLLRSLLSCCVKGKIELFFDIENSKQDKILSVLHKIILLLLSEGADIYDKNPQLKSHNDMITLESCIELIAQLPPSYTELFIQYFPNCYETIFYNAAKHWNNELIRWLNKQYSISNEFFQKCIKLIDESLRADEPRNHFVEHPGLRDPYYMQKMRIANSAKLETQSILKKLQYEKLIKQGENPHLQLIIAAGQNNFSAIQDLFQKNKVKNINMQNHNGENALMYSMANKNIEISRLLIENGAKIFFCTTCLTPFHRALETNDISFLDAIFKNIDIYNEINMNYNDFILYTADLKLNNSFKWLIMNISLSDDQYYSNLKNILSMPKVTKNEEISIWLTEHLEMHEHKSNNTGFQI